MKLHLLYLRVVPVQAFLHLKPNVLKQHNILEVGHRATQWLVWIFIFVYFILPWELSEVQTKELEWYLRDYFFRQYTQGNQEFNKESLAHEMIRSYLRYRDYNLQDLTGMINIVVKILVSRSVIMKQAGGTTIQLTNGLSRLQCSKCFYISYLSNNEPMRCLRCSSMELHDFPKKMR